MNDDELKHSVSEELQNFSRDFHTNGIERLKQGWQNCVETEADIAIK
jgi:hypothetical protein